MKILLANLKHLSLHNCRTLNETGKLHSAHNLPALAESSTARARSVHTSHAAVYLVVVQISGRVYLFIFIVPRESSAKSPPKDGG